LTIAPDVSPELARSTIASLTVLGALYASPKVKAALSDRVRSRQVQDIVFNPEN
jgi:hypothetical protein